MSVNFISKMCETHHNFQIYKKAIPNCFSLSKFMIITPHFKLFRVVARIAGRSSFNPDLTRIN